MSAPQSIELLGLTGQRSLTSSSSSVWGYIRHELVFLSFAAMELSLLTPVVLLFIGWARYWPTWLVFLWLLLVMLLPLNLIRLMGILHVGLKRQRQVLIIGLFITLVQSWRLLLYSGGSLLDFGWLGQFFASLGEGGNMVWTRDFSVFVITSFIWWRGIRLAIRHPEINNVGLRLRLGGLIFLPVITWLGSTLINLNIVPFITMFFLSGLTLITLVRAENIEEARSGKSSTLNPAWLLVVSGAALLVVIISGVATGIISGDSLFVVLSFLSPLWRAIQFGAAVAGFTLLQIVYPGLDIFALLVQFLSGIFGGMLGQVSAALRESNFLAGLEPPELPGVEEAIEVLEPTLGGKTLAAIIMVGLVILIGFALARTYRKSTFTTRESEKSRKSMEDTENQGAGRRLLERFGLLRQWRAAASVRRIYRLMCKEAGLAGYPRLGSETPFEYLPTLYRVWPEHTAETRMVTEAFVRIRYGELPETAEELESIRNAWRIIEASTPNQRNQDTGNKPPLEPRE